MISPEQCRMARAGLGWTAKQLATAAGVGVATVNRFEAWQVTPIPATLAAIQRALEAAGIEFTDGDGVRRREPVEGGR